ncbi:alpha/beta hydrolase [Corynebacterium kroppenstedtii]|uniref:alpha/beta hydrolase n=1 Tax=Corynebacterium sp. PCR 32 TaxID=3351342 RepID=UPI0030AE8630
MADKLSSLIAHLDKRGPHRVLVGDLDYVGIPGKVYLPADGDNVPGVVFGHDWMTNISAYHGTLRHLASWGIAVAAPDSETGLRPNAGAFAHDLRACLSIISGVQMGQGSITVHPEKLVLAGHGFGASAAVLAAADAGGSQGVTGVAAVFPRGTSPRASGAATSIDVPGLVLAPGKDSLLVGDEALRIAAQWRGSSYYREFVDAAQSVLSENVVKNLMLGLGSAGFSQRAVLRGLLVAFVRATAESDKKYRGVLSDEELTGTEFRDRDDIVNDLPENADVMDRLREAL